MLQSNPQPNEPTMNTLPNGRKAPTAPPGWPFGTVKPPTQAAVRREAANGPAAPF